MKKEIIIPEATVTVETKFYAVGFASVDYASRNQSPVFDTYDEAMQWIANDLNCSTGQRTYKIEATHGRFDAQ